MLIDRYAREDVFARVPELADQTDPVLVELDHLLDDDTLYQHVRGDLAHRYRLTPVHGRHSTPAEVLMRLLVVQQRVVQLLERLDVDRHDLPRLRRRDVGGQEQAGFRRRRRRCGSLQ